MRKGITQFARDIREIFIGLEENKKRRQYHGGNVTILARNCVAGVIYHDLGLEFQSPTVNLWIQNPDFEVFLTYIHEFVREGILKEVSSSYDYPVGDLSCNTNDGEKKIRIYFQHYKSFYEAQTSWYKRCKRVNFDRMCVIIEDGNNITQDEVDHFEKLAIEKMVILCGEKSINGKHVIHMKGFTKKNFPGTSVKYKGLFGKRWLDEFDWIHFLE